MKKITAKPLKNLSNSKLWTDLEEETSAQISGGRIAIGETSAVDGFGRPVQSQDVTISLVLLFANPFA